MKNQIKGIFKEWQSINKKCTRLSKPNLSEQQKELVEGFKKKMDDTFLITDRNAEELISKDKMRDRQQKEEDIAFLTSMKEDRIASVSTRQGLTTKSRDWRMRTGESRQLGCCQCCCGEGCEKDTGGSGQDQQGVPQARHAGDQS